MRYDDLDRFSRIDSPIHRLSAEWKLGGALALLLATILTPIRASGNAAGTGGSLAWIVFGTVGLLLLVVAALSRVPAAALLRRLGLLGLFVVGITLLAWLQQGTAVFLRLLTRSTLCLATAVLLSCTTPFSEILRVFRRARVPGILLTMLALLTRYLFVLVDEAERMDRARSSRTFSRGRVRLWRTRAGVIGQLFVRSTLRAERIYAAMCARGWKP